MLRFLLLLAGWIFIAIGVIWKIISNISLRHLRHDYPPFYTVLTNLSGFALLIFFLLALVLRIGTLKNSQGYIIKKHKRIYKFLLPVFLCLNSTVFLGYWYLFFLDLKLFHKSLGSEVKPPPLLQNLCRHVSSWAVSVIECIFTTPALKISHLLIILVCMCSYSTLVILTHKYQGKWPYPLFENKSYPHVLLLISIFDFVGVLASFLLLTIFRFLKKSLMRKQKKGTEANNSEIIAESNL